MVYYLWADIVDEGISLDFGLIVEEYIPSIAVMQKLSPSSSSSSISKPSRTSVLRAKSERELDTRLGCGHQTILSGARQGTSLRLGY